MLFTLKVPTIEPLDSEIRWYFLLPKNISSTLLTAPVAVGSVNDSWKTTVCFKLIGSPSRTSTINWSATIHSASEEVIVLSNGFKIVTLFPNNTWNNMSSAVSVPFEV